MRIDTEEEEAESGRRPRVSVGPVQRIEDSSPAPSSQASNEEFPRGKLIFTLPRADRQDILLQLDALQDNAHMTVRLTGAQGVDPFRAEMLELKADNEVVMNLTPSQFLLMEQLVAARRESFGSRGDVLLSILEPLFPGLSGPLLAPRITRQRAGRRAGP